MKSSSFFRVGKLKDDEWLIIQQVKLEYFINNMLNACRFWGSKIGTPESTADVEKLFKLYAEAIDLVEQIKTLEEKIDEEIEQA